jgi:hypothetical protein
MIVFTFSIIQYSHLKDQLIGPEILCHLTEIATKVMLHCYNYFLRCLIIPYNLFISRSHPCFRSRDITNMVFLYDDQKLRRCLVGVPLSFLACVSSGTRRPFAFPPLQPTFRPLRQAISSFLHSLRHSAIPSSIFRNLSQHSRSRPRPSSTSPYLRSAFSTLPVARFR